MRKVHEASFSKTLQTPYSTGWYLGYMLVPGKEWLRLNITENLMTHQNVKP